MLVFKLKPLCEHALPPLPPTTLGEYFREPPQCFVLLIFLHLHATTSLVYQTTPSPALDVLHHQHIQSWGGSGHGLIHETSDQP